MSAAALDTQKQHVARHMSSPGTALAPSKLQTHSVPYTPRQCQFGRLSGHAWRTAGASCKAPVQPRSARRRSILHGIYAASLYAPQWHRARSVEPCVCQPRLCTAAHQASGSLYPCTAARRHDTRYVASAQSHAVVLLPVTMLLAVKELECVGYLSALGG